MSCRLFFAAKLSIEPMLTYFILDPQQQVSVKFESEYKTFCESAFEYVVYELAAILAREDDFHTNRNHHMMQHSIWYIKNNARVTVNNDFLGHEWGDLPMIFVTSENHWQIESRVTQKSLFTATNVLFYFLHAILCLGTHNSAKNHHRWLISQLSPRTAFSDFALWRHHSWSVTSREREILALWRHICRLFLHVQIGAKAIFTSE